ncbi:Ankyrin repeat [Macleaya cordata]|uniref:Ankyrin repeat n=1 Tax=Macleaya cordata TaxID=56857 RepID=A0A200PSP7_MACCD|nr:Ankyrin repeat [Macleaya cordata]
MAADQFNVKRAALRGEWEAITNFYRHRPTLTNDVPATGHTLLHMCAQCCRTDVMKDLLKVMPENVVEGREVDIKPERTRMETPIYRAAMYGHKEMLLFLYFAGRRTSTATSMDVRRNDGSTILHAAVQGEFMRMGRLLFGLGRALYLFSLFHAKYVAMEILELYPYLAWSRNEDRATASHVLALAPSSFKSGTMYSYHYVELSAFLAPAKIAIAIYAWSLTSNVSKHVPKIWVPCACMKEPRSTDMNSLMEWLRSEKKRDLAKSVVGIDKQGNTALHAAAKFGEDKPWHIRGAAHQMHWECVWFEDSDGMILRISPQTAIWTDKVTKAVPDAYVVWSVLLPCRSTVMAAEFNVKRAALRGEWEAITNFYRHHPALANDVPVIADTLLHKCAQFCQTGVMKELLKLMPENVVQATDGKGNTVLHEAVRTGIVEMAEVIIEKEEGLISSRNVHGETPIYWAAMYGLKEMLLFLYFAGRRSTAASMNVRRKDGSTILHAAVLGKFYDVAMEILELYPDLAWSRKEDGATASHILALSPSSFKSGTIYSYHYVGIFAFLAPANIAISIYALIPIENYKTHGAAARRSLQQCSLMERCKHNVKSGCPVLRNFYVAKEKHTYIMQLTKQLLEKDSQWNYGSDGRDPRPKDINCNILQKKETNKFTERPLILATKMGIIEMFKETVRMFPESLEFVEEKGGKNVLHLAAEHRHEFIMEWLKSKKKRDLVKLVVGIDSEGNTALHAAANLGEDKPWHIRGPAHRMQWECIWFERIKYLIPPHMITIKNSNDQSAKEVFTKTHKELLEKGEKWLKDVSNSCMIMSTLIATVVFASAFTVPGGNDEKTGLPILLKTSDFTPFIQYAAASLFFSLLSLGLFLSIHSSRFNEDDFYAWLPLKIVGALTMLFNSTIFMIASFSQAYFLVTGWRFPLATIIFDVSIVAIGFYFFVYLYLDIILCFLRYLVDIVFI